MGISAFVGSHLKIRDFDPASYKFAVPVLISIFMQPHNLHS